MFGEFYALFNDHADMALLMRLVECGITGDYLILNIVYDLLRYRLQFQFRYFAPLPFFFQYLTAMGTFLSHTFLTDMASVSLPREFFICEILTALPTIMAHIFFYFGFDICAVIALSVPCLQETVLHVRYASLCALTRYSAIFAPDHAGRYVVDYA